MFSLERYRYRILGLIGTYALFILCGVMLGIVRENIFTWIGACALVSGAVLIPMVVYYVYLYISTKKRFGTAQKLSGVISNWRMSELSRMKSYLLVSYGEKEYETSTIFSRDDAPDYVGQSVSFILIGDIAVILEVQND